MIVLPSLKTDRKLDRWQTDRWAWMEMLFYCYLQTCVTTMLLLVQKSRNRNGSPFQSAAHLSSACCCAGCPCEEYMLTRSNGPLPLASSRTGLCLSVTWEESTKCCMASGKGVCSHPVVKLTTPKMDTGYSQRARPVASCAKLSLWFTNVREKLDGHIVSPRCLVRIWDSSMHGIQADKAPCPPACSPLPR